MAKYKLVINEKEYAVDVAPDTPLLWVLRDELKLTGTKFSCGVGVCGACTVHVDGAATRSCVTRLDEVEGKAITTIEGLSPDGNHPLQKAWLDGEVSQCGYCQPGQIMTAAALLLKNPHPTDEEIDAAMGINLCRCGTYQRIRETLRKLAAAGGSK